jgi:hypothetical protein
MSVPAPRIDDARIYAHCMDEVKERLALIQRLIRENPLGGNPTFTTELIFVQFRKVLELIALGSLSAHKDEYAKVHKNFTEHWKADKMLGVVEKLNPAFWPMAVEEVNPPSGGLRHLTPVADGFMTRDEFVRLHNACAEVLHSRNPFSQRDPVIDIGYTIEQWIARIQRLLKFHAITLVDGGRWLIVMSDTRETHVYPAGQVAKP